MICNKPPSMREVDFAVRQKTEGVISSTDLSMYNLFSALTPSVKTASGFDSSLNEGATHNSINLLNKRYFVNVFAIYLPYGKCDIILQAKFRYILITFGCDMI